jgi:hypothetical protein
MNESEIKALLGNLKLLLDPEERDLGTTSADRVLDLHIGEPTAVQLKKINALLGGEETEAKDWLVVPYMASNNLVDHDYRRWHISTMFQFATQFIGKPNILDHSQYKAESGVGFIFQALVVQDKTAPAAVVNGGGFGKLNKKIIAEEGYVWLYLASAIPAGTEAATRIKARRYNSCSTGSLVKDPFLVCPNCSAEKGREVTFYETTEDGKYVCPHLVPSSWAKQFVAMYDEKVNFADYAIFGGLTNEPVEHSICVAGALPAAQIIRET